MRHRAIRLVVLVMATATAGCEDMTPPARELGYPLEDPRNGLTFHWPRNLLPVRYWVAGDAGVVSAFVQEGLRSWSATFIHGEFRAVMVADSTAADVLVFVEPGTPPAGNPTDDSPVVGACRGQTGYTLEALEDRLRGPFRVTVEWNAGYPDADVVNCLERVTVHELGHTLGLFGHSANEADLMHPSPRVREPSAGDRATAEILYHTAPTIAAPRVD